MYLLELVEWSAGNIQQQDIPARSPAVRAKYVNSKNVALEILRMFVLNFYEPLLDTSIKSNVRHYPDYSRDLGHKAGRGLGIRDDKAHGFYNKFTWKVEKLETIFLKCFLLPFIFYLCRKSDRSRK